MRLAPLLSQDEPEVEVASARAARVADKVSELLVVQTALADDLERSGAMVPRIAQKLWRATAITRTLFDAALRLRLVPLRPTFTAVLERLADVLGPDVHLHVGGGHVEVDREVGLLLRDPLERLLRNAMVYARADRPLRVRLDARGGAGRVRISVTHDGLRPDVTRLRRVLASRAGTTPDATEAEVSELVFGGLVGTRKDQAVEGIGPGLELVRRSLRALGGDARVDLDGAEVRYGLDIPLATAMTAGFLTYVGRHDCVVPTRYVRSIVALRDVEPVALGEARVVRVRDEVLPLVELRSLLGDSSDQTRGPTRGEVVVVVEAGDRAFALLVDGIEDERNVVFRSLGTLNVAPVVAGVAMLGGQRLALLLDPRGLLVDLLRDTKTWNDAHACLAKAFGVYLRQTAVSEPSGSFEEGEGRAHVVTMLNAMAHVELRVVVRIARSSLGRFSERLFGERDDELCEEIARELTNLAMGTLKTGMGKEGHLFAADIPRPVEDAEIATVRMQARDERRFEIRLDDGRIEILLASRRRSCQAVLPAELVEGMVAARDVLDATGKPLVELGARFSHQTIRSVQEKSLPEHALLVMLP